MGEIWGYRKVYTIGLLLFSCTSLACALSDSLFTLIIARTLQGFGAAAIASVNTALIRIIYPKRFLGRGMGINALVVSGIGRRWSYDSRRYIVRGELALVVRYKYPDRYYRFDIEL